MHGSPNKPKLGHRLAAVAHLWPRSTSGNVAILFGLVAVAVVGLIGLGIDYYRGLSYKARLDAAADAAALAAITTAEAYINDNSHSQTGVTLTNDALAAGIAQANKVFPANAGTAASYVSMTPTLTRTGQTFNSTVSYSGQIPASFGGIFGINVLNLAGESASSLTMATYLDFYLVLDVSGSMGIPTTQDGQTTLAGLDHDDQSQYPTGCVFACHFSGYQGFGLSRTYNIPLRVDTVGSAVQALLATATQTATLTDQFRVGIYPFIVDAIQAAPLSSNFATANTVAGNFANYLDQGTSNNGMGSGGTHFENLWNDVQPYLQGSGSGSGALNPKAFIFLVTDGADNNQIYTPPPPTGGSWTGSQPQLPSITFCSNAKAEGYTVSVLYIPYVPIVDPNPTFANDEDDKVNAVVPSIPGLLQQCASTGFYFKASTPQDINNAMQTMFAMALQAARLTN